MTKNITLALPDDLWARMEKLGEVNWSAVARESIERYVANREGPGPVRTPEDDERLLRDQIGLLVRALRTDLPSVKESTMVQLSVFGPRAVPYLKAALSKALREASAPKKPQEHYSEGVPISFSDSDFDTPIRTSRLEQGVSNPEGAITGICTVLGMIGDQRAFPELREALPRVEAVRALAKLRSAESLTAITDSIPKWFSQSKDSFGRRDSKYSVGDDFVRGVFSYFGEEGEKRLHELLHKGPDETRQRVSKIVAVLQDKGSLAGLRATLENGDYSARAEAARAVLELGANEAVPALVAVLFKIREYSLSPQLQKPGAKEPVFGRGGGGRSSWEEEEKKSRDREAWREACEAIGKAILQLGSLEDWVSIAFHWPSIKQVESAFREAVQNSGEKAVPALTRLLQAPQAEIQRDAAEMIARIKRGEKYERNTSLYRV